MILPIILDVTNDDHTQPAVSQVNQVLKDTNTKLVAIINNASINPEGEAIAQAYASGNKPPNILAEPAVVSRVLETNVLV